MPAMWKEFLSPDSSLCELCGNSGIIHTVGVRSPAGVPVPPARKPCICPNGRGLVATQADLDQRQDSLGMFGASVITKIKEWR